MQLLLSWQMGIEKLLNMPSFVNKSWNHSTSLDVSMGAWYFKHVDNEAIDFCFLLLQVIGMFPILILNHLWNFWCLDLHPSFTWLEFMPLLYISPKSIITLKYFKMDLTILRWFLGLVACIYLLQWLQMMCSTRCLLKRSTF